MGQDTNSQQKVWDLRCQCRASGCWALMLQIPGILAAGRGAAMPQIPWVLAEGLHEWLPGAAAPTQRLQLPEEHLFDAVVGALAQHERCSRPRRPDVLNEVRLVDRLPDAVRVGAALRIAERRELAEERVGV